MANPLPAQNLSADTTPHLYLVDASGFIFRAFHALPSLNRKRDGVPVGAVLGFTNMLLKLLREHNPSHMAVVFDVARHTFRNDLYTPYKANRDDPPPDLVPQFALVREATDAFGLPRVELPGYEADDVMATLSTRAVKQGFNVTIVSSDKDLMQLVTPAIRMWDPIKNIPLGAEAVFEKFGVTPDKVPDVQALAGDSTDNVPGIAGIGVKTAAELINTYGDLETLLNSASQIKQPKRREALETQADNARISYKLVSLEHDCDLPCQLSDLVHPGFDAERIGPFLAAMEFTSLLSRLKLDPPPLNKEELAEFSPPQLLDHPESAPPPKLITQYRAIIDPAELKAWLDVAIVGGRLALDTETTDLTPARADLVGLSLAGSAPDAIYVPFAHKSANPLMEPDPVQMDRDAALAILKPVLEDTSILKIGLNMKFDWQMIERFGVKTAPLADPMMMSYVLDGTSHGHGMDELARLHLNHTAISYDSLTGTGVKRITFDYVPLDQAIPYAAEDAAVALALYEVLAPRLRHEKVTAIYEDIERPLIRVLAEMEATGITIAPQVLQGLSSAFGERLRQIEADIYAMVGHPFNIGSPKQLGQVLFEELGLPGGRKTKTGDWSTSADVLEELAEQGHEQMEPILAWRQLSKLMSTYTEALPRNVVARTGRVHTSYSMAATSTGRLSSSDPNLQNIPIRTEEGKSIRTAFITQPGWKIISADYSQIELRLVAEMAGIERLQQAFRDGIDIHTATASEVFGLPIDDVPSARRREAKAINFGIIYGISAFGLCKQIGCAQHEAAAFIKAYFARFPQLKDFMDAAKQEAREHGFVRTLYGRKCFIPGINDKNPARRAGAERQAINAPVQGTAADIIKLAMNAVHRRLREEGFTARLLLQVHDELVLEAPDDEVDRVIALLHDVMPSVANLGVPLAVEAHAADNWAAAH